MSFEESIMDIFRQEIRKVIREERESAHNELMTEREVMEWLGQKDRKMLQKWRMEGLRSYQPSERKRYYLRQEVEDFIVARGD